MSWKIEWNAIGWVVAVLLYFVVRLQSCLDWVGSMCVSQIPLELIAIVATVVAIGCGIDLITDSKSIGIVSWGYKRRKK